MNNSNDSEDNIPIAVLQRRDIWKEQYKMCGLKFPTICVSDNEKRYVFAWNSKKTNNKKKSD